MRTGHNMNALRHHGVARHALKQHLTVVEYVAHRQTTPSGTRVESRARAHNKQAHVACSCASCLHLIASLRRSPRLTALLHALTACDNAVNQ